MQQMTSLAMAFVVIAIAALIIDVVTDRIQNLLKIIPIISEQLYNILSYIIVLMLSYYFCWQGNFDLFLCLNISFNCKWQGWLMTALIISGGSKTIIEKYNLISKIPSSIFMLKKEHKKNSTNNTKGSDSFEHLGKSQTKSHKQRSKI